MRNLKTKILALYLILASAIPCIAQNAEQNDSLVNVIAFFSMNDTTEYRETHLEYKVQDNDTIFQHGYSEKFQLIVRDSTATDYTIECISNDFDYLSDDPDFADKLAKMTWDITKKTPLIIKVDSLGALVSIINWKEYRNAVQPAFKVACEMLKREIDENVINIPSLILMFNSKTNSEDVIAQNNSVTKMFSNHGLMYKLGEKKVQTEFSGYPTEINGETYIIAKDSKDEDPEIAYAGDYGIKSVSVTKAPAAELSKKGLDLIKQTLTTQSISEIDKHKSDINEEVKKIGDVNIINEEHYAYFFNGWPKYIGSQKTVDIGISKNIKIEEIEWTRMHWK